MNYDQLLASRKILQYLKKTMENIAIRKFREHKDNLEEQEKIRDIENKIRDLNIIIKGQEKLNYEKYPNKTHRNSFRNYKKLFKQEFLRQAYLGYPFQSILESINNLIPNPGVNPIYIVRALRENGYFWYENENDENTKLNLSAKALRYLENEANISLRNEKSR